MEYSILYQKNIAQKNDAFTKDCFSKCDQIHSFPGI